MPTPSYAVTDLEQVKKGSLTSGVGRPQKYPWNDLLNGAVWVINVDDLTTWELKTLDDFRQRFNLNCHKRGLRPITRKVGTHPATAVLLVQAK